MTRWVMAVAILINVVGAVGTLARWLLPALSAPSSAPPTAPVVSRVQYLADTAELWAGAWFDPKQRVLWTATQKQTHALCAEPPSQWEPAQGTIGGCYEARADIIVLPVDASQAVIDHEQCHRLGWRHLPGKTDNEGWPAACEARPWRHAFATHTQRNAR